MSDQSPPGTPQRRRSSFAELFASRPSLSSTTPPSTSASSSLSQSQHIRGASVSVSTKGLGLGLGGGSPEASPFTAFARQRQASVSTSSGTGSPEFRNSFGDEPAVLEDDDAGGAPNAPSSPSFARRMSFGAQALRDVKQGSIGGSGGGEGFNWSDALRDKTKRSPSFSTSANPFASNPSRHRSTSIATSEPPKDMPKPAPVAQKFKKPDHLGERMLRGDFMMD